MRTVCTLVVTGMGLLMGYSAHADVATLHPVADTGLFQAFPDNNLGTWSDMPVGTTRAGANGRGLLKFDLSQVPPNAVVSAVSLQIQVTKAPFPATPSTFSLHRMLVSWNEGVGGGQIGSVATNNDTTWNKRIQPDIAWGTPGAAPQTDYATETNGEVAIADPATYIFQSTAKMVADVQFWITNANFNFGWIMICEQEGTTFTARRVATREDALNAPTLTVTYTSSGTTAQQPRISNVSAGNNQIHFTFNAEANRTYAVEFRGAVGTGNWQTLTNIPAQPNPAAIPVSDSLANGTRFYRVRTP